MSLISGSVQRTAHPLIDVLYLRGRFENSVVPTNRSRISAIAGGRVQDLVRVDAGEWAPQDHARRVPARFGGREAGGLEPPPDRRDVLDPDPVELHVLPIRHVRDVAPVRLARPRDRAELIGGEPAAVDPDPHHEELVLELLGLGAAGPLAGHALLPLRVEAPPAHPVAEILLADRAEAARREDPLDPLAHLERLGLLLDLLGGVQRFVIAERPLPLTRGRGDLCSVRAIGVPSRRWKGAASRRPVDLGSRALRPGEGVRGRLGPR